MAFQELEVIYEMAMAGAVFDALLLAFRFGRAKGYRMAKREV